MLELIAFLLQKKSFYSFVSNHMNFCTMLLMPTVGSSVHIIQKFLFECKGTGVNGPEKFHKPYYFTWLGSLGMFLVFVYSFIMNPIGMIAKYKNKQFLKPFLYLAIATFFNLSAGTLSNISSLYINYSVSLMLRSSTLIFGALISTYYLKKPLKKHQKIGVYLTLLAIVFVTISALLSGSKSTHKVANSQTIAFFVIIRTLSKSLQAISMLIEEKVMKSGGISPVEVTGLNGIWSLIFSTLLLPIDGLKDTFLMIISSTTILILSIVSVVVFAIWTILGLQITSKASAVSRMVFDQLTIVFVWIVQLSIYWYVIGTKYEDQYLRTGEAWTKYSIIQVIGFCIIVYGACVYQNIAISKCCGEDTTTAGESIIEDADTFIVKDEENAIEV